MPDLNGFELAIGRLAGISLITLLLCFWIFFLKRAENRLFFLFFFLFLFVYSGIGWSYEDVGFEYIYYYTIYVAVLSGTIFLVKGKEQHLGNYQQEQLLLLAVKQYGSWIIGLYLFLCLGELVFPEFKLQLLINPPLPDIKENLADRLENAASLGIVGGILYYLRNLAFPFYLCALLMYRKRIFYLVFLVFFPLYIQYCAESYISRGVVLINFIVLITCIYIYNRRYRKWLLGGGIVCAPFLLLGAVIYSYIRLGYHDVSFSFKEAFQLLVRQETFYPIWFNWIYEWKEEAELAGAYWEWLFSLPLPSFMKAYSHDIAFNAIFSEYILEKSRYQVGQGFSILLPGVMNESIFLLGKINFFLHAVIFGILIGAAFRILKYKVERYLFLYVALYCSYTTARGGTIASYPFLLKHLLIFAIVVWIYLFIKKQRNNSFPE
ncbi:hypothetical protein HF882_16450 [Victivallis vadensis]|uniref:Oligosaccharide repeat unit polymerase n=1 Tax=Victivallis vadensis TaxID=172901 RepID=A0A848B1Q3_9BACT|nr:hypothetical protein [Victivallis vadensis]NMD88177.1 hypothetical protein [Victivallis vadensis]